MGFYLRKSISVGPLRFNLSKSGVGVSAGFNGLRVGVGPRGNYVHAGRGGLYYRATIASSSDAPSRNLASLPTRPLHDESSHEALLEIESENVANMVPSSSKALLQEIDQKQKTMRLLPVVATVMISTTVASLWSSRPIWVTLLLAAVGGALVYAAYQRDILTKTVVLFFDLDPATDALYGQLHADAEALASCAAVWHVEAEGKVLDRKYHAGASSLVRRTRTRIQKQAPPFLKTNIETVAIAVGRQTLHFFPDRILVYDRGGVGAVDYRDLRFQVRSTQFVEGESVPSDAKIVGNTWKYVNKSGGPDKRFKDNRELPICQYEEMSLTSQSGLSETLQLSKVGPAGDFSTAVMRLGTQMPIERE